MIASMSSGLSELLALQMDKGIRKFCPTTNAQKMTTANFTRLIKAKKKNLKVSRATRIVDSSVSIKLTILKFSEITMD